MALNPNTNAPLVLPSPQSGAGPLATNDIREIKDPVPIATGWEWLWWTLGAMAVALFAWRLWRLWKTKRLRPAPQIVIPPHRRARERLQAAMLSIHDPYKFCGLVSDIIRQYLEEAFNFHAPDRTTEEFMAELQASHKLTQDQKAALSHFLAECDLVKFARHEPMEDDLRRLFDTAMRLVEETVPRAPAPEPEAISKNG